MTFSNFVEHYIEELESYLEEYSSESKKLHLMPLGLWYGAKRRLEDVKDPELGSTEEYSDEMYDVNRLIQVSSRRIGSIKGNLTRVKDPEKVYELLQTFREELIKLMVLEKYKQKLKKTDYHKSLMSRIRGRNPVST